MNYVGRSWVAANEEGINEVKKRRDSERYTPGKKCEQMERKFTPQSSSHFLHERG